MQVGEGVEFVHQTLGMHPAERMATDGELGWLSLKVGISTVPPLTFATLRFLAARCLFGGFATGH